VAPDLGLVPYTPHLTLGRVKRNIQATQIKQLAQAVAAEKAKIGEVARFQVREIYLMRSQLQPSGPVYSVLQRAEIDG
jgi:2'-5' RNA ligase